MADKGSAVAGAAMNVTELESSGSGVFILRLSETFSRDEVNAARKAAMGMLKEARAGRPFGLLVIGRPVVDLFELKAGPEALAVLCELRDRIDRAVEFLAAPAGRVVSGEVGKPANAAESGRPEKHGS